MAALYLHNAIFIPEPSDATSPHTRNLSTLSSGTLHTTTSEHSHPTEPLLQSTTSESVAYLDLLSRQPTHPNASQRSPDWDTGLSLDGDAATARERKGYWEQSIRKRLKRLKAMKGTLEAVIGELYLYVRQTSDSTC